MASVQAKAKAKAKKASGVAKPRAHPPYVEMIKEAIVSLKERTGSSQYAIAKFIEEKQKTHLPSNFRKLLLVQLKKLVASGKLVKVKHSFKLGAEAKAPASKAPAAKAPASKASAKKKVPVKAKASTPVKTKKVAAKPKAVAKPKKAVAKPKKAAKTAAVTTPGKKKVATPAVVKTKRVVAKAKAVKKPKSIKSPAKKVAAKKETK